MNFTKNDEIKINNVIKNNNFGNFTIHFNKHTNELNNNIDLQKEYSFFVACNNLKCDAFFISTYDLKNIIDNNTILDYLLSLLIIVDSYEANKSSIIRKQKIKNILKK